jgi:transposase
MSRPTMRFVPVKTAEQQAALTMLGVRDLQINQRTMLINALRGHAAEFGVAAAKGPNKIVELLQRSCAPQREARFQRTPEPARVKERC